MPSMRVIFGAVGRIIAEGSWPPRSTRIEWMAPTIPGAEGPMSTVTKPVKLGVSEPESLRA